MLGKFQPAMVGETVTRQRGRRDFLKDLYALPRGGRV